MIIIKTIKISYLALKVFLVLFSNLVCIIKYFKKLKIYYKE